MKEQRESERIRRLLYEYYLEMFECENEKSVNYDQESVTLEYVMLFQDIIIEYLDRVIK